MSIPGSNLDFTRFFHAAIAHLACRPDCSSQTWQFQQDPAVQATWAELMLPKSKMDEARRDLGRVRLRSKHLLRVPKDHICRRKLVLACCLGMAAVFQTLLCLAPKIQSHTGRFVYCCTMMVMYTMARGNDYGQLKGIAMRTLERFNRPAAFGNLRLWGAVSWGIAHPTLGYLLDVEHGHLELLFIGNAVAASLAVASFSLLLRSKWTDEGGAALGFEGDSAANSSQTESAQAPRASVLEVMKIVCSRPDMITWLLCAATQAMGMQHVSQFLFLYMEERFHSSDILMGFSVTITVLFEIPIFAFSEKLLPRLGPTILIAIAMGSFVVRVLGYTIVPSAGWMLFLEPLHGVTYSCFTLATVHYLNEHVPMHMISTAQGFMSSVAAAGSALGAVLGGWIMDMENGGVLLFRADSVIMAQNCRDNLFSEEKLCKETYWSGRTLLMEFKPWHLGSESPSRFPSDDANLSRLVGEERKERKAYTDDSGIGWDSLRSG
ncbi:unnamed protein product [Durusdinium trenchii]|uniref:Major facilitator superfamily associated domain-containing protein n=1 Tax=Durusdinium trenchii TaxID=1381693 RepID=A0ABP0PZG3_9DINO